MEPESYFMAYGAYSIFEIDTHFISFVQNSVFTFVLRGCDSISLVPYVPGPILATICCTRESDRSREQLLHDLLLLLLTAYSIS